ncbi:hypothetical protein CC78DRAFT_619804 [Lojkania enalia]|uniref:Peptidase S54 rhomboid domain-containing protein n=1 Tax=Lojkania enalia TaxID=147567 RepID=A0A9P4K6H3_9PLEO|nr:hypothetical protein CC78DRAFT_619804 [Didymosphaeria enalia]
MSSLLPARLLRPIASHAKPTTRTMSCDFFRPSTVGLGLGLGLGASLFSRILVQRRLYSSSRYYFDNTQKNMRVIYGFIGINCAVFAYKYYATTQLDQALRSGSAAAVAQAKGNVIRLMRNFTVNLNEFLDNDRWWTLIARTPRVGPGNMIALVLGSAISGGCYYLLDRAQKMKNRGGRDLASGLGFSGAVTGVGAAAAFMYPHTKAAIFGILPVPMWLLMLGYVVYDGYYLSSENSRTAHAGHLGGLAFGAAFYFTRLRSLRW